MTPVITSMKRVRIRKSPKMLIICLHPYLTGRPSRSKALDDFLSYIKEFALSAALNSKPTIRKMK
jgi:hypothetical protein